MTRIKFGRMRAILSKSKIPGINGNDDDSRMRSSRYRRRFFSRSGRRHQQPKNDALAPSTARSYRRRVTSRAGIRNRAAAQTRKRVECGDCDSDTDSDFESDTDTDSQMTMQTTLSLEGGEDEIICICDDALSTPVSIRWDLPPEVITMEDKNNDNTSSSNGNTSPNTTASILNEANRNVYPSNGTSLLPQLIEPVTTAAENDVHRDPTINNGITMTTITTTTTTTTTTAAQESLQLLFVGKKQQSRSGTAILPLLTCQPSLASFMKFRMNYLGVYAAIMLADGLQGTHLYALYSGYGYSVANLYSLGFITGAITSPFIGPLVDRFGRKRSAMLYCVLEILINVTEQYENLSGLIASRVVGGITTNLLSSVFESWLATEHRRRRFDGDDGSGCGDDNDDDDNDDGGKEPRLALVMRDSTIVSNMAAIVSGYIAHRLAERSGNGGPFGGAVFFTFVALVLVGLLWTENYGNSNGCGDGDDEGSKELITFRGHMVGAFKTIVGDTKISRIGLIQGLTEGTLQTFVFLWSPALASFALGAPQTALGLGPDGEPAYGLIFGGFMACGVIGGVVQPYVRKNIGTSAWTCNSGRRSWVSFLSSSPSPEMVRGHRREKGCDQNTLQTGILCALCYLFTAVLLLIPCMVDAHSPYAFSMSLTAFLLYELLVGLYMPCQGVIRSIFMPKESTCSVMTMLRVVVNVAVALGVISTNYISFTSAFATLSAMMVVAAGLQLSIVPKSKVVV